ncbi:piwi-like protein Ago3 [Daktulosphaira vitifoliae]|uniref:piwi-like protein Ago3 n=1 Tax=Daktulosphaira vitifoliae TaxID=58002 RepID=UPI0021A9AC60|nr:piwi-like protein Ago3 [Daktulosphaira vitifoliae]
MAGRGFLKSRIAQMTANEAQATKPPEVTYIPTTASATPVETVAPIVPVISAPLSIPILSTVPVTPLTSVEPSPSNDAFVVARQCAVRGRRALLARGLPNVHIVQQSETIENVPDVSGLSLGSVDLKNLRYQEQLIQKSVEIPVETTRHQESNLPLPQDNSKCAHIEQKFEKPPVICRVQQNKVKPSENFKMVQLSSNYIKISLEENKGIYEYRVDYDPPVDARQARFALLNQHRDLFPVKTFDGTALYIPSQLPQDETILISKLDTEVKLTIKFKRKTSLRDCIHFYNVFLRQIMKVLGLVEFGRSVYDPTKRILVQEYNLEVWPGYITSIDEYESGLYLCCEVSHRVLRTQSVLEIMTDIMKSKQEDCKQEIMAALCGSTVITHYNRKTYRIDDIDFSMTPLSTFEQNGVQTSYVNYYKTNYNIEIKSLKQPLLISKAKKKDVCKKGGSENDTVSLVPELCNLTGLTENMKTNFKLMKALHAYTLVSPEVRQGSLMNFVERVYEHEVASKKLKDWGLNLRPIPVKLEGPVYRNENIIFGNEIRRPVRENVDWGIDITKNAMFAAVNMKKWAILFTQREEQVANSFCNTLIKCGRVLGMDIDIPIKFKVNGIGLECFVAAVNKAISNNCDMQLIVIIFPNQREDRYNAVKKICCAELGIPSQVIVSRTLFRPEKLLSITQKIALQLNCKLGGSCWAVEIPLKSTMIVGIDVYHEKGKQVSSVVGFVASLDKHFTQWTSVAAMQKSTHQELVKSIQDSFHKVIQRWKMKNGELPDKIIIFRDGVGDGDLKQVEEMELHDLEESFKSYPGSYSPKITYVIVQKRINTRVFQYISDKKYANPAPGTVIDNTITRRNHFDFFLVSQHTRQGTVNPTHYIVLQNSCKLSTENVQRLSYKLCHLYYNWCGTIKVPAPVQYAHKLAYLIGQNVRQMPSEKLCNTLFFL